MCGDRKRKGPRAIARGPCCCADWRALIPSATVARGWTARTTGEATGTAGEAARVVRRGRRSLEHLLLDEREGPQDLVQLRRHQVDVFPPIDRELRELGLIHLAGVF